MEEQIKFNKEWYNERYSENNILYNQRVCTLYNNIKETTENKNVLQWLICPHCNIRLVVHVTYNNYRCCWNGNCMKAVRKLNKDIKDNTWYHTIIFSLMKFDENNISPSHKELYSLITKCYNTVVLINLSTDKEEYKKNIHLTHIPAIRDIIYNSKKNQFKDLICESPHPNISVKDCLKRFGKIDIVEEIQCIVYLGIVQTKNVKGAEPKLTYLEKMNDSDYDKPLSNRLKNIIILSGLRRAWNWNIVIYVYTFQKYQERR
jgi:hypothetical protein